MANDSTAPPPPPPEEWARQATDSAADPESRNRAFKALQPDIRQAALAAAHALHADARLRNDLIDESSGHIAEKLPKYSPELGSLRGWLQTVLHNYGCSLRRRHRFQDVGLPKAVARRGIGHSLVGRDLAAEAAATDLELRFAALRAELDACAWPPSRRVDYYAVLLTQLRLELADLYRASRGNGMPTAEEVAERVAAWLPWQADEEIRRFRPDLPTLALVWQKLKPRLGDRLGLAEVVTAVNGCLAPGAEFTYDTLAQWMFRARVLARERIKADAWQTCGFARLLEHSGREFVS